MKKIVCYGDSNTFGFDAKNFGRLDENTRWCGILKHRFSGRAEIINMGLNGRTVMTDDFTRPDRNACKSFESDISGIIPDIIIIMLGTNDCKFDFMLTSDDIADHMDLLIEKVKQTCPSAEIILISPVPMNEDCIASPLEFNVKSAKTSGELAEKYEAVAGKHGIAFFDAGKWDVKLSHDGCHYSTAGHRTFSDKIAGIIKNMM